MLLFFVGLCNWLVELSQRRRRWSRQVFRFAKQTAVLSRRGKLGVERSETVSPVTRTKTKRRANALLFASELAILRHRNICRWIRSYILMDHGRAVIRKSI